MWVPGPREFDMQSTGVRNWLAAGFQISGTCPRRVPGVERAFRTESFIGLATVNRGRLCASVTGCRSMRKEEAGQGPPQDAVPPGALLCALDFLSVAGRAAVAASLGAIFWLGSPVGAIADDIVRFPASANPEVFTAQKTLVEAWTIIREGFFDDKFNNKDWDAELSKHMSAAYQSDNRDKAYDELNKMLEGLGDPYTRLVPPEQYADFLMTSDGELHGVGLLIAMDPQSGRLVVLTPIRGGPADKAGVMPGDELLSINGESTQGWDGARAAKFLRGKNGTVVTVKLARRSEQIPGVPGVPEPVPDVQYREVKMKRGVVELSPVFSAAVDNNGETVGYIKLTNFSSKAAEDTEKAIKDLEKQGAQAFVLDLRNNPGGLVQSGLDVARLWMDGTPTVFEVSGRNRELERQVALGNGLASTDRPLVVLVNRSSASASEILAGALHDNHRATVVGDRTYGKGKIQTVFELQDGSALFVTVATYQTPGHKAIDNVGIQPDVSCSPNPAAKKRAKDTELQREGGWLDESDLGSDNCFMTAERILQQKTHV